MRWTLICGASLLATVVAAPVSALMIDDFTVSSSTTVDPGPGSLPSFTAGPSASIVGGDRGVLVHNLSGGGAVIVETETGTGLSTDVLSYSSASGVTGGFALFYNGPIASGLGGLDFTDGGASNGFVIGVNLSDFASTVAVQVVDTLGGGFTSSAFSIPTQDPGGAPVEVAIPFASVPGVDFTTVDSVFFNFVTSAPETNLEILSLETGNLIPEPGAASLLVLFLSGVAYFRSH